MIFAFEGRELDTELCEVRHDGEPRKIEPQVFDLLHFLIRNRDKVVTKDEIIDEIWDGRIVTDAVVSTCMKAARRSLGDDGKTQRFIRTVHGRGFRFVSDVREIGAERKSRDGANSAQPGIISLALLPFEVFSDDPAVEFFADGLVEDLTTALARLPDVTVISRSSSFTYKGQRPSAAQVRDDLNVTHMIEGSVRSAGDRRRINVQLINTERDAHAWADSFDHIGGDASDLGDEIIRSIARRIEPELLKVSYRQACDRNHDRDAWALYRQASGLLAIKGWHEDTFTEAATILRQCLAIDPDFARAHAYLALILALGQRIGLLRDRDACVRESLTAGDRALILDDHDPEVLGFVGCALADVGQARRGITVLERAIEQDPSNAQAWVALGTAKLMERRGADGLDDLRHGIRISPLDNRLAIWESALAFALMGAGNAEEALAAARTACRRDLKNHIPQVTLAAILLGVGESEVADSALGDAMRIRPDLCEAELGCLVGKRSLNALRHLSNFPHPDVAAP